MNASIPKGTRDFLPKEVENRQFIFSTIKKVFQTFGYVPIETPAFENLSTLTGKYGEEGDQLLFKILNNGDFLKKANKNALEELDSKALTPSISKRGLKYDLTVPFARFVVMHQNELYFPFKRYQIQAVWRADRPQKGRYQEFFQCDADVVGSESLLNEAEMLHMYDQVFETLGINVTIKLNNRKVLYGLAEIHDIVDLFSELTLVIDKLDKIGEKKAFQELQDRGISQEKAQSIISLIIHSNIESIKTKMQASKTGMLGIKEIEEVLALVQQFKPKNSIIFDMSLARGLGYYTGCIMEVQANDIKIGSIGGGGRYANLTANFGGKNLSGVGISFGAERIYDIMQTLDLFPKELSSDLKLIILSFNKQTQDKAFQLTSLLRRAGIGCDIYPDIVKMRKQMKYAHDRQIPYVGIIGEEELQGEFITLKNMATGFQEKIPIDLLVKKLRIL